MKKHNLNNTNTSEIDKKKTFNNFFMEYHPNVKNFIYGFIKDEEEANDITQDIFLQIWISWDDISKIQSIKAYLFSMAKNRVYDYFKHSLVKQKYADSTVNTNFCQDIIEESIYAKELELIIDLAIKEMPERRQEIFLMSREKGLSNDQIAKKTGINKRTVENHITQALSDLRKIVKAALSILL